MTHRDPSHLTWDWRMAVFALAVFLIAFGIYHAKADFAFFYHTDEPSKAAQLVADERNYYHPLLLLNSAGFIYQCEGRPQSPQAAIMAGRLASAIFSAAALAMLVATAFLNAGWIGGILCAVALLLESSLFEFAHYFKEDPAMNFALAMFCLVATLYGRRSTLALAVLLGMSCGLAVSAKYIGIICLPFGVWVLLAARSHGTGRWLAGAAFTLAFLGAMAAVNWQMFFEMERFLGGFQSEMGRVQDRFDESGSFHEKAVQRISVAVTPIVGFLLLAYLLSPLYRRRVLTVPQWTFIGLPAAFALLLLSASRTGGRYNAPITLLAFLSAFIAAGWLASAFAARFPRHARLIRIGSIGFFLAVILLSEAPKFIEYWNNLRFDSRALLMRYVEKNLPATAFIAEEYDVRLPDPAKPDRFMPGFDLPQQRFVTKYKQLLSDTGSLQELRGRGITHVVIVWSNEKKKLSRIGPDQWPRLDGQARIRAMFYYQLAREGAILWECRGGAPDHVRPPLRLYEITPRSSAVPIP